MEFPRIIFLLTCAFVVTARTEASQSIARVWDEQILSAIRIDLPHPPVHARNLFHLSVAMYDAWAAYDTNAVGYLYHGKHTAPDVDAARRKAISYAAYRILRERYTLSRNAVTTLAALDAQMTALGYDKNYSSQNPSTPGGLGNKIAATVSAFAIQDGSRQLQFYADYFPSQGGYVPVNPPMIIGESGTSAVDVNRWQPLSITNATAQNGVPISSLQSFLGAQWLGVRPFALVRDNPTLPWIDPGPQPRLGGVGDAQFKEEVVDIIRRSSQLTPDDGEMIDLSPGVTGNNSLGANDGTGHPLNPVTGLPYETNLVKRGDFARYLAEYWADGPSSETPPGHWNSIANHVAENPLFVKKLGGTGPVLDDLEWDVKVYFVLNASLHDAACAAWSVKRVYDGGRPIEFVRYMAQLGQSSDPEAPSYHTNGLPLVTNLIELVTTNSSQIGERHEGLSVGEIAVRTWPGQPVDPTNQHSGLKWILAKDWMTYQKKTFVTPAFPGYVSGHSTFSRAAAEVMTAITGSSFFPGGLEVHSVGTNSMIVEYGPSEPFQLQWATYYDAADQAGQSRLWGGIHVTADDFNGRRIGSQCGLGAWALAQKYYDGSVASTPVNVVIRPAVPSGCEIKFNTFRGLYYKLQSTASLLDPFEDDGFGFMQALDSSMVRLDSGMESKRFYRVVSALEPDLE